MIARELLGTAQVPGGEELKLYRHDRDFMIVLGHNELMSTRMRTSEEALATMTLERLEGVQGQHLLVGGYGMGFTLRAALAKVGGQARNTVAELVPEIIEWARGPMAELTGTCLDDPRVRLVRGDVAEAILLAPEPLDAILLDVDNGPDGLVRPDNNRIYSKAGLHNARKALRAGGILAVWSADKDPKFRRRMEDCHFEVEEVEVRARANGKGPRHVIWFGRTES
ncbi:MAG: spermidine synthase [Novosphingobium sp.]